MRNIIISILFSALLLGCATFNDVKQAKETIYQVSNGSIAHEIKSIELTSTELAIIDHSFNKLNMFINKWIKIQAIKDFSEFSADYKEVKNNYLAVHKVIEDNFNRYPEVFKSKLIKYKQEANHIDNTVHKLLLAKDVFNTGKEAVKLAMVVVGLLK